MNRVKTYLGKRGSGKSTRLLNDLKQQRRVVVYNTLMEPAYDEFQVIDKYEDLIEVLKENPSYFRIAYRGIDDGTEMSTDFDFCCRAIGACKDVHFAVEEIGLHSNSWKMPLSLQTIVSAGRHNAICFYCTSQRASAINPLIRALSTEICSFIQTEPRDIEWLTEVMGDKAYEVRNLPQYQFILWSDKTLSQSSDIDFKPVKGVQSSNSGTESEEEKEPEI